MNAFPLLISDKLHLCVVKSSFPKLNEYMSQTKRRI